MGQLITGKITKIVIYDKVRVNGRTNFYSPWRRLVPKLEYIFKVEISVFLFVCLIITQEPLNRFASNFDWGAL